MIKRIIFDLDNTIMIWKDDYINALRDTLLYFNVDIKYLDDINNIIEMNIVLLILYLAYIRFFSFFYLIVVLLL